MPPDADPVIAASTVTTTHSDTTGSGLMALSASRTSANAASDAITAP